MELQYEKINLIEQACVKLNEMLTPDVCELIDDDARGEEIPTFDSQKTEELYKLSTSVSGCFNDELLGIDVLDEIAINSAGISSDAQLKRYLQFVRNKVQSVFEMSSSLTSFSDFSVKYWGDVFSDGIKANGKNFLHPDKLAIKAPITNLRVSYLRVIEQILVLRDHIDSLLQPGQTFQSIVPAQSQNKTEKTINNWQVIPDPERRVFYDKWANKFQEAWASIQKNKDIITKINQSKLTKGSLGPTLDTFINWANSLSTKHLPDQDFSHEIMNEIDVNLLELKTKREKDKYLRNLSSELAACSYNFKQYTKTHPDYIPQKVDWVASPDGDFQEVEVQPEVLVNDWRKLQSEKHEHTLNEFYAHLLVLAHVLDSIVDYADGLLNPEQPITLEHELELANHRLLLFHRLGLFKPLSKKYFNILGPGKFAKLLKTVLGIDDKEVLPDTFRKAVENFVKEVDNLKVTKPTITKPARDKVDAYLTEIGLRDLIDNEIA